MRNRIGVALAALGLLVTMVVAGGRPAIAQPTVTDTLSAGSSLQAANGDKLVSDFSLYELAVYARGLVVQKLPESANAVVWSSAPGVAHVPGPSTLSMRADGNLVLSDAGGVIWSSDTAGTGANRVVVTSTGNLVMFAGSSTVVWSSEAGGLFYQTSSYLVTSRQGSAVYANGLFKLDNPKSGLIRDGGRLVYLQRAKLDGSSWAVGYEWQNVLSRTTDSVGVVTVGFIQPVRYRYRWFALGTANSSTSGSAESIR